MTTNHDLAGTPCRSRNDVLRDVCQIVAEQVGIAPDRVLEEHRLEEDLDCDSLMLVEITMEIEEHFDISIPDGQEEQARTVGQIADGVLCILEGLQGRG
ncbi:MAG: acyl carrier protein [Patescibacteria group bacterium]|nr:acyl carrier protein [Patescibacteria group bacterium]